MARQSDQPTGADLVLLAASEIRDEGRPYGDVFLDMCEYAAIGDTSTLRGAVASRALNDYEAAAAGAVIAAAQIAVERDDVNALHDVLLFGLPLLAKWPEYLTVAAPDGHPQFQRREESEGSA